MRAILSEIASALLPAHCPGCGAAAEPICSDCESALRRPAPVPPPSPLRYWAAAFAYQGAVRELIAGVKYRNQRHALTWLASRTAEVARQMPGGLDAVTHVPTTAARRRSRGFDHGALLADAIAYEMGLAYRPVLRRRDGLAQTGQAARSRRLGPDLEVVAPVSGLSWLIVDDVATTGGSLSAAARALVGAGADYPCAAVAARTPAGGFSKRAPIIHAHG